MTVRKLLELIEEECKLYPELPNYSILAASTTYYVGDVECRVTIDHEKGIVIISPR